MHVACGLNLIWSLSLQIILIKKKTIMFKYLSCQTTLCDIFWWGIIIHIDNHVFNISEFSIINAKGWN